jgi:hypothetical protein
MSKTFLVVREYERSQYTGYGKPRKKVLDLDVSRVEADSAMAAAKKTKKSGKVFVFDQSAAQVFTLKRQVVADPWLATAVLPNKKGK